MAAGSVTDCPPMESPTPMSFTSFRYFSIKVLSFLSSPPSICKKRGGGVGEAEKKAGKERRQSKQKKGVELILHK